MKKEKRNEDWKLEIGNFINSKPVSELWNHPITLAISWRRSIGGMRVGYGREGPPGRARSPGTENLPLRDHPPWQLLPEFIEGKGG